MPRREEISARVLKEKLREVLVSAKDELTDLVAGQRAKRRELKERGDPIIGVREQQDLALRAFELNARRKLAKVRGGEERE